MYKELSYVIRGLLFQVHNELGQYRNEKQYGDAFAAKLNVTNIKYEREKILPKSFVGEKSGRNRVDFIVEDKIIVELKCVHFLSKDDYFQCQRYLVSKNLDLALLVNFRPKFLRVQRVLNHEKFDKNKK